MNPETQRQQGQLNFESKRWIMIPNLPNPGEPWRARNISLLQRETPTGTLIAMGERNSALPGTDMQPNRSNLVHVNATNQLISNKMLLSTTQQISSLNISQPPPYNTLSSPYSHTLTSSALTPASTTDL